MLREEKILIGTAAEIEAHITGLDEYDPSHQFSFNSIEEQLVEILFEGALMENAAMGMLVYMVSDHSYDEDQKIPKISIEIRKTFVWVKNNT